MMHTKENKRSRTSGVRQYVVVHQVTDGIPTCEVKDEAGNIKTVHCN